jgi:SH3-like domain-containing protein
LEQRIGEPFRVYDVGTNALYQGRTPTITGAELRSFSVLYDIPGGYEEFRYCLIIGDNWRIRGYTRKEADGSELKLEIVSGQMTVTQTSPGSPTNSTQLAYPFSTRMRDVCADSIPTSLSGAQASVSAMPVFANDTAAVFSREMPVNLRQGPSTQTKSLGKYNGGTILRVSGFEGDWAKVQIGSSVGYMSIIYLQIPCSVSVLDETQLPTGKMTGEGVVKLYEQANESSDILGEYESGQYMHILASYGNWLQVCIPQGNMSWMMDQNGVIGYVRVQNVEITDILP